MTDTPEPAVEGDSATAAPSISADPASDHQRRSLWGRLNRTNRIAALILGAVAAVIAAVLIFGAGLLLGAEFNDSEGHHDGAGTSEYSDSDRASGEHEGNDGESADEGDRQGSGEETDGEHDRGQGDAQERPGAPEGQAPGGSNGAPRP
jgi:hypothetical protein